MAPASSSTKFNTFINDKYIPLERKVKIILAVLIFLLPVVLFYFFIYSPSHDKIKGMEAKKISLTAVVKKAKHDSDNIEKYEKEVAEAKERFETIAVVLPKAREIPDLLRNISDLGKGAGLDFISFKPAAEIPKEFYGEIPIDISIRGPYHNMGYFLDQVSKLERIVTVDNIKMDSPKKEGSEMLLNSSCRLVTYRFTNKVSAPDNKKNKGRK